jgi:hypothetical protein
VEVAKNETNTVAAAQYGEIVINANTQIKSSAREERKEEL